LERLHQMISCVTCKSTKHKKHKSLIITQTGTLNLNTINLITIISSIFIHI